jgi:hypothetical protein
MRKITFEDDEEVHTFKIDNVKMYEDLLKQIPDKIKKDRATMNI